MPGITRKLSRAWTIFLRIATMPWACQQAAIEQILQEPNSLEQDNQLQDWKKLKNKELTNVSFVVSIHLSFPQLSNFSITSTHISQGTLIASATTGSIQWGSLERAHWIVPAAWYITLILSLMSVMVAFYLSILLSNFTINREGNKLLLIALHSRQDPTKGRWGSLFALQVPMMILSYSLIAYITGLSVMVIRPLWIDPWGPSSQVSNLLPHEFLETEAC